MTHVKKLATTIVAILVAMLTGGVISPTASAASEMSDADISNVVTAVSPAYTALTFESDPIVSVIANKRFTETEKLNRKTEIFKKTKKPFNEITEEEVLASLRADYLQASGYKDAFTEVTADIAPRLSSLIANDSQVASPGVVKDVPYYQRTLSDNAAKVLLGLTYEQRLYNFRIGDVLVRDALMRSGSFGKGFSPLDLVISLGSQNGQDYALGNNARTFTNLLGGKISDQTTVDQFLRAQVGQHAAGTDVSQWFVDTSRALIEEVPGSLTIGGTHRLFEKLSASPALSAHILPLLTLKEPSVYVISTLASIGYGMVETYVDSHSTDHEAALASFKTTLKQRATDQGVYLDLWARLVPEKATLLSSSRLAVDAFSRAGQSSAQQSWSPKSGDAAASAVKDFFGPLNLWNPFQRVGAQADPSGNITYWLSKQLTDEGASAYTHEMTHQLVADMYLNGHGIRSGSATELLPRGLYESYSQTNEPVFNVNQIYPRGHGDYMNNSPERFRSAADLRSYMKNLLDVVDTLDYLEADIVLSKDAQAKQKWFNVVELAPATTREGAAHQAAQFGASDEVFKASTPQQAASWHSINDLIDANAVVSRYEAIGKEHTGVAHFNDYYVNPLFSPLYGAPLNDAGMSGDIHTRRIAWELLGQYGYLEGMVPYLSNQYKPAGLADKRQFSDQVIIPKISGGQYQTVRDFRKASYQERAEKLDQLKPVTITLNGQTVAIDSAGKLRQLMSTAIEADLAATTPAANAVDTAVEKLKAAVYRAYKADTHDFTDTIYLAKQLDAEKYQISGGTIQKDYAQPLSVEEIVAKVSSTAPTDRIVSTVVQTSPLPTAGENVKISVVVTYADTSSSTATVLVSFKNAAQTFSPRALSPSPSVTQGDTVPNPRDFIAEPHTLPADTAFAWERDHAASSETVGAAQGIVLITYPDHSTDQVAVTLDVTARPVYSASYQFVADDGSELPAQVTSLLPSERTGVLSGEKISPTQPAEKSVAVETGTWALVQYQPQSALIADSNVTFIGTWHFTAKPQPKLKDVSALAPAFDDEQLSLTIPVVEGVRYRLNGEEKAPGTYTVAPGKVQVSALAADGYVLAAGSTSTWNHSFLQPKPEDPQPDTPQPGTSTPHPENPSAGESTGESGEHGTTTPEEPDTPGTPAPDTPQSEPKPEEPQPDTPHSNEPAPADPTATTPTGTESSDISTAGTATQPTSGAATQPDELSIVVPRHSSSAADKQKKIVVAELSHSSIAATGTQGAWMAGLALMLSVAGAATLELTRRKNRS